MEILSSDEKNINCNTSENTLKINKNNYYRLGMDGKRQKSYPHYLCINSVQPYGNTARSYMGSLHGIKKQQDFLWVCCTAMGSYLNIPSKTADCYMGMLHGYYISGEFCGKNSATMWIKIEKIGVYMGTLHDNIWERCTITYGNAARKKQEKSTYINKLHHKKERLSCF